MKRFRLALLAIGSAALAVAHADGARPRYGGTLRVQEAGTLATPDPSAEPAGDVEESTRAHVLPLVFETLVSIDASDGLRPRLAVAWESDRQSSRWRFRVRPHVILHDGSVLESWHVASALRRANAAWTVTNDEDTVVVDLPQARPDLPWELAEDRYGVAVHAHENEWIGSGPFRLHRLESSHLTLRAHERYWNGRPFVDTIEVEMAQPAADQMGSLELGRADIVSVKQTDLRRLTQRGLRSASTRPLELVALVFEPQRSGPSDERFRRAVAAAIDRTVLSAALLQGQAEPAAALLPSWISGYTVPGAERGAAKDASGSVLPAQRRLILRIDSSSPLAQAIADRIVVDARALGIAVSVQVPAGLAPRPDARLVQVKVAATSPDRALAGVLAALGSRVVGRATEQAAPSAGAPIEEVYRFERALVDRAVVVPVVHLRDVYGISDNVETWTGPIVQPTGAWDLANAWLSRQRTEPR